jgi:predicted esterase
MRIGITLLVAVLVLPGCGSSDEGTDVSGNTGGALGNGGVFGTGGLPVATGGMPVAMGGMPVATGGMPVATGGDPGAGGGPDPGGSGGFPNPGGGATGTGAAGPVGGSGGGGTTLPPPTGTGVPRIPEVTGTCPDLKSGVQTIMGLSTNIVAGTPGATKGPILFTWHGTGGNGQQALFQLPGSVQNDIKAQGGIVIAASSSGQAREGTDVTGVLGVWYDVGDLKYADFILACAIKNNNIDPNKIFVTGCSAGGLMTGTMALQRSYYVAAAAPNSGGLTTSFGKLADATHVPATFCMNGGDGDTVIINFGTTCANLDGVIKAAGGFAVDCNHASGHCGAPATLHEFAWTFMKAHPFNVGPSPYKAGLPATFPQYCTIK